MCNIINAIGHIFASEHSLCQESTKTRRSLLPGPPIITETFYEYNRQQQGCNTRSKDQYWHKFDPHIALCVSTCMVVHVLSTFICVWKHIVHKCVVMFLLFWQMWKIGFPTHLHGKVVLWVAAAESCNATHCWSIDIHHPRHAGTTSHVVAQNATTSEHNVQSAD